MGRLKQHLTTQSRQMPTALYQRSAMVMLASLVLSPYVGAQSRKERALLEFVRDAHRATRESIRTFSSKVRFDGKDSNAPDRVQSCSGHYWISDAGVRSSVSEFDLEVEQVWKDSELRGYVRSAKSKNSPATGSRDRRSYRHIGRCDPWVRGLLVFVVPGSLETFTFESLVARAAKVVRVARTGNSTVVVSLEFDIREPWKATCVKSLHFDSSVNHMVRRVETKTTLNGESLYVEEEVEQFREVSAGQFFPARVVGRSRTGKPWTYNYATDFSDVLINPALDDAIFKLRFPHGIRVVDSIRGVTFLSDGDGNPISQEVQISREPLVPPRDAVLPGPPGAETASEPRSTLGWYMMGFLLVFISGFILILRKRFRRSNEDEGRSES